MAPVLHFAATTAEGWLRHAMLENGTWTKVEDAGSGGPAHQLGVARRVALAAVGQEVHLAVTNAAGELWHALRDTNGVWTPFGDVKQQAGNPGRLVDVALTTAGTETHIATINELGAPFHAIRWQDGTWTDFGDVFAQTGGGMENVVSVALTASGHEVHLVAVENDAGLLWHSIRLPDGTWTPAELVWDPYAFNTSGYVWIPDKYASAAVAMTAQPGWPRLPGSFPPLPYVVATDRNGAAMGFWRVGSSAAYGATAWNPIGQFLFWLNLPTWTGNMPLFPGHMRVAIAYEPAGTNHDAYIDEFGSAWHRINNNEYRDVALDVGRMGDLNSLALAVAS